jgi:lipopolysaccharide biosynthesis protein
LKLDDLREQRFALRILALVAVYHGEALDTPRIAGLFFAWFTPRCLQNLGEYRLALVVAALDQVQDSQIVHGDQRVGMFVTQERGVSSPTIL